MRNTSLWFGMIFRSVTSKFIAKSEVVLQNLSQNLKLYFKISFKNNLSKIADFDLDKAVNQGVNIRKNSNEGQPNMDTLLNILSFKSLLLILIIQSRRKSFHFGTH